MSKPIVALDAGHGGRDPGAISQNGRMEKDDTLRLSKAVGQILSESGVTVLQTRSDDRYFTLAERVAAANNASADLYVSLHRNSYTNAAANGAEIWVYTTAGTADVEAASEVLERLARAGVQSNRGVKKGNYHVLRESKMTSMLIELNFISNEEDNRLFDSHFDNYALAIAQGICNILGVTPADYDTKAMYALYRVQVGAFRSRQNAEDFLKAVKNMGLEAFIVEQQVKA